MYNESINGIYREYDAVAEIAVFPFSKIIKLQPVHITEKDGRIIGTENGQVITIGNDLKINPETLSIDNENGVPAYDFLDSQFKGMIESFAQAWANYQPIPDVPQAPEPGL